MVVFVGDVGVFSASPDGESPTSVVDAFVASDALAGGPDWSAAFASRERC
ncbi:hypothetical protein [Asanoa ferruginea]|nr:hypothetical protein [Asanoa ferruginea]